MNSMEICASDTGTKCEDSGESASSQEAATPDITEGSESGDKSPHDDVAQSNNNASDMPDPAVDSPEADSAQPEFVDILGNGTLLKKVVLAGEGKRPEQGDRVVIGLVMHMPELKKSFPPTEKEFILFDGDVEQALDLIVSLMDCGEKAEAIAGYKYMYGDIGLEPDIPPCANFKLEIHLKAVHGPPDYPSMNYETRFNEAKQKKERGNFLFRRKEYSQALNSYTKSSKILDPELGCVFPDETPERLQELLEFRAVIMCNTSVAQVRVDAPEAAVKSALEATKLKPTYGKAYYRLGQAYEKCGQIDDCIKSYKLALKHDVENVKFIHGELERLTKKNKNVKQNQQEMYSKMFWGSKPPPMSKKDKKEDLSLFSWLWKVGLGVIGAGAVGLAGIGLFKYTNH